MVLLGATGALYTKQVRRINPAESHKANGNETRRTPGLRQSRLWDKAFCGGSGRTRKTGSCLRSTASLYRGKVAIALAPFRNAVFIKVFECSA